MRDHTKLRGIEGMLYHRLLKRLGFLCIQNSSLIEPKVVETEKVLNGLIYVLQDG